MLHGPVNGILALTTHEKVMFFDMDRRVFLDERSIGKRDVKAYDPGADGRGLVTAARTKWWTDTIEINFDILHGMKTLFPVMIPGRTVGMRPGAGSYYDRRLERRVSDVRMTPGQKGRRYGLLRKGRYAVA